jgi:hypothetical protein
MKESEAIRIIKNELYWEDDVRICEAFETAIKALEENQQYHATGTVRDFEVLKERIEPKKVVRLQDKYESPSCHRQLKYRELLCCGLCGQKLEWE